MLRSLVLAAIFVAAVHAAIWPDRLGPFQRKSATGSATFGDDRPEWDEYGEAALERADYGPFQALAFQFKDTTGAYGASLEPGGRVTSRIGNYLVSCSGECPKDFLKLAELGLPHVSHASIPTLGEYLPARNRVPKSERYILGPVGLRNNAPQIPLDAAAFQFGTEAELAHYRTAHGQIMLAIFSYPTPAMARQQAPKFQEVAGSSVKRTGSLVAIALGSSTNDQAGAEKLLSEVNYTAAVSINETPPLQLKPESAAQMLLAIFNLAGLVLGFCLISGLLVAGILYAARRFGYSGADETLTTLHLSRK
jgi:hypothetical protein